MKKPRKKRPTVAVRLRRPVDAYEGPEGPLTQAVVDTLLQVGCVGLRINSGSVQVSSESGKEYRIKLAPEGTSDVLGVLRPLGRGIAVETKVWPNKPTVDQVRFLTEWRRAGGIGIVAYSLGDVWRELIAAGLLDPASCPDIPPLEEVWPEV